MKLTEKEIARLKYLKENYDKNPGFMEPRHLEHTFETITCRARMEEKFDAILKPTLQAKRTDDEAFAEQAARAVGVALKSVGDGLSDDKIPGDIFGLESLISRTKVKLAFLEGELASLKKEL